VEVASGWWCCGVVVACGFRNQTRRGLDGATAATGGMGQGRVRFNLFFLFFYPVLYFSSIPKLFSL